ncbi:Ras GTPase activating protein ira2 [Balamuthia mandrillaris]
MEEVPTVCVANPLNETAAERENPSQRRPAFSSRKSAYRSLPVSAVPPHYWLSVVNPNEGPSSPAADNLLDNLLPAVTSAEEGESYTESTNSTTFEEKTTNANPSMTNRRHSTLVTMPVKNGGGDFSQVLQGLEKRGANTPRGHRSTILNLLMDSSLNFVTALCASISSPYEYEACCVSLMIIFGHQGKERELVKWSLGKEILQEGEDRPHTLFRGNTVASKCMSLYIQWRGRRFLQALVVPLVTDVMRHEAIEVNPSKLRDPSLLEQNQQRLLEAVELVFSAVESMATSFPSSLQSMFHFIFERVTERWPGHGYQIVGGFFWLRFMCPALVTPEKYEFVSSLSTSETRLSVHQRRSLILITKIIQNLSNGVLFGEKEKFMGFSNAYIQSNEERMQAFLANLCNPTYDAPKDGTLPQQQHVGKPSDEKKLRRRGVHLPEDTVAALIQNDNNNDHRSLRTNDQESQDSRAISNENAAQALERVIRSLVCHGEQVIQHLEGKLEEKMVKDCLATFNVDYPVEEMGRLRGGALEEEDPLVIWWMAWVSGVGLEPQKKKATRGGASLMKLTRLARKGEEGIGSEKENNAKQREKKKPSSKTGQGSTKEGSKASNSGGEPKQGASARNPSRKGGSAARDVNEDILRLKNQLEEEKELTQKLTKEMRTVKVLLIEKTDAIAKLEAEKKRLEDLLRKNGIAFAPPSNEEEGEEG